MVIPKYGLVGGAEGSPPNSPNGLPPTQGSRSTFLPTAGRTPPEGSFSHPIPIVRFPKFLTTTSFAWFAGREISAAGPFDLIHTHDRIFRADLYTMHGIPHRWWVREVRRKGMSLFDRALARVEDRLVSEGVAAGSWPFPS